MAEPTLTTEFTLPAIDTGVVLQKTSEGSAFARAVGSVTPIPSTGLLMHTWQSNAAAQVAEGALKPFTGGVGSTITVTPVVFSAVQTVSNQLAEGSTQLAKAIFESAPVALSEKIDAEIADGVGGNFDTLEDVSSVVEITTPADFSSARKTISGKGVKAESIVLSTELFYDLQAQTNALGIPTFPGLQNEEGAHINGVPVYVFTSSEAVGWVGPFRTRAIFGVVEGYPKVDIELSVLEQADGSLISLKQRNLQGVLSEVRAAFKVADKGEFVKLVSPEVEPEPEPEG